jgi:hypothetical protein
MTASRSWGDQDGHRKFQVGASPLWGIDGIDSSGKDARQLFVLREAWLCGSMEGVRRTSLVFGRMRIETGPGLSTHPSLASPLSTPPDLGGEDPQERNPFGVSLEQTWAERLRTAIQFFPSLSPSPIARPFVSPQFHLLRLEQALPLPAGNSMRLECGIGHEQVYGGSWEWSRDGWFLSSEAAIRNDGSVPDPVSDPIEPRIILVANDRFCPFQSFQIQKDLTSPGMGTVRLSLEWVESALGLSVAESRSIARRIEAMSTTSPRTIAGALARKDLADLARSDPWIESYAHRLLLRLGSAESLRWGGGINALFIGPSEGLLLKADAHCSLGNRIAVEGMLTSLTWAHSGSLVGHLPLRAAFSAGLRWCW